MKDNFRIGFVFWASSKFGGMERRYVRLASHLASLFPAESILIFAQRRCLSAVKEFLPSTLHDIVIPFGVGEYSGGRNIASILRESMSLSKEINDAKVDHLHFCGNPGLISCLISLLARNVKSKSLAMVDTTFADNSSSLSRSAGRLSLKHYDAVDCLSDQTKEIIERFFPKFDRGKNKVAPASFSDYSLANPRSYRDLDIVTMARFTKGKGYYLLEELGSLFVEHKLSCFGFGPKPPNIQSAEISYADKPFEILGRSKIFLSLQSVNNYPSQSVLEAMASECAIIATDVGETRKFLDESCAVLIPYSSKALGQAIKHLMANEELRRRLGECARERVLRDYTVDRYAYYFLDEIVGIHHPHHHRP